MRALALLLALALPASAQQFGVGGEVYSSGPSQQWFGYGKANGTSGPGVYMTPPRGTVGWWDPGNAETCVVGARDAQGTDDYLDCATTPIDQDAYPIVVWGWAKVDSVAGSATLWVASDSGAADGLFVSVTTGSLVRASSYDGGVQVDAATTGTLTVSAPFRYVAVFESSTSRAIYTDFDTTGGTNTTSNAPASMDRIRFFAWTDATSDWDGAAGPTWVFRNATVPSSNQRLAFLRDCHDPEVITGTRASALWFQAGSLTDARGDHDLSATGTVTDHPSVLWALRDMSGANNTLLWISSLPSFGGAQTLATSGSILNGQQHMENAASSAASGLRTNSGRVPATAVPLQGYIVFDADVWGSNDVLWQLGLTTSVSTHFFRANITTTTGLVQSLVADTANTAATTVSTYSLDTSLLMWSSFSSATARSVEVNGGDHVDGVTTSRTPVGINFLTWSGFLGGTVSNTTNGQFGALVILNTSSIAGQTSIERFMSAAYALGF